MLTLNNNTKITTMKKALQVTEIYPTLAAAMPVIEKQFDNFGQLHNLNRRVKIWEDACKTEKVLQVAADPKFNYGLDFKLYHVYKTRDGIRFCKEICISSALTNADLQMVAIYQGLIMPAHLYYSKSDRKVMRKVTDSADFIALM